MSDVKIIQDWYVFGARLNVQWDCDLYNDIEQKISDNGDSVDNLQTIEYEEDYHWMTEYNDRQEEELWTPVITDFCVFTEKFCYTFECNRDGEKFCVSTPRNPVNKIPFGVRVKSIDSQESEGNLLAAIEDFQDSIILHKQNEDYEPYDE